MDSVRRICQECVTEVGPRATFCGSACRNRAFRRKNPGRYAGTNYVRNVNLKTNYGITVDEWQELLEAQGNVCAICGTYPELGNYKNRWATDHDHETGKVRGILCHGCNRGIGLMQDDPQVLLAAAQYLLEASNG